MIALWMTVALAAEPAWDFVQLATGEDFTCGRTRSGQVACWGNNEDQQLGVPREQVPWSATPVDTGLSGVVDIAAGGVQACAVLQTGEVRCWGQIRRAAWGQGELPTKQSLGGAASAALGPARGCVRQRGGVPACWEDADTRPPQLGYVANVRDLAVGTAHACALVEGGDVWCWGDDREGQLGGQPTWKVVTVQVEGVHDGVDLAAGADNTCLASRSGRVTCWGPNADGQLGRGHTSPAFDPEPVVGMSQAVEVSVGPGEACARTADGKVLCWGADPCPAPDRPSRRLKPVDLGIRGADALSEGSSSRHRCALVKGAPVCWGPNDHGQLGVAPSACVARPE